MAKLELPEPKAIAAEAAWREGRYVEAQRLIAECLESDAPLSREFRTVAAKAMRAGIEAGLKRKQWPPRWGEIGSDFERLCASGVSKIEAYEMLSDQYTKKFGKGFSVRNIRTAVAYYQKACKVHDECERVELKARVEEAIAANPAKSDRMIAEEIGVNPETVRRARATAPRVGNSVK